MVVLLATTASEGPGQVLAGPNGPVEFIGLQSWNAQELFDAIQELEPDRPFHACAAVMKLELGFADAAAFLYFADHLTSIDQSSSRYTVVVGVEDSTQVQYRPAGNESVVLPQIWQDLQAAVGEEANTLIVAARMFHLRAFAHQMAESMGSDPETLNKVWELLERTDGDEDLRLAHEVLTEDSSWSARAVATLLLGNFIDDGTAWHGLVGSLIDSDARVRTVASSMLEGLHKFKLGIGKLLWRWTLALPSNHKSDLTMASITFSLPLWRRSIRSCVHFGLRSRPCWPRWAR